jgi:hypothetical protein
MLRDRTGQASMREEGMLAAEMRWDATPKVEMPSAAAPQAVPTDLPLSAQNPESDQLR